MAEWVLRERFVTDAGEIAWDRLGEGSPVVMVHGTPWSSWTWRRVAPRLAERFSVYVFDLLGFGAADSSVTIDNVQVGSNTVQGPVAVPDLVTTPEDTPATIAILKNDSSPVAPLDPATVVITHVSQHGTATIELHAWLSLLIGTAVGLTITFSLMRLLRVSEVTPAFNRINRLIKRG